MPAPAPPVNNPATHGKEGIVAMKMNAGDPYVAIGNISDWALNMATDKVETTALGDANKRYVIGLKDLTGTFSAFWDRLEKTGSFRDALWSDVDISDEGLHKLRMTVVYTSAHASPRTASTKGAPR